MPKVPPQEVNPLLRTHQEWVQSELKIHRGTCTVEHPTACTLRDVTVYQGQLNPVCLGCKACNIEIVVFKTNQD